MDNNNLRSLNVDQNRHISDAEKKWSILYVTCQFLLFANCSISETE